MHHLHRPSKTVRHALCAGVTAIIAVASGAARASGDADQPTPPGSGWTTTVSPYVWAASAKGDAVIQGQRTSVDAPFSTSLKNLELVGMGQIEFAKGKGGFWFDGNYTRVSEKQSIMSAPVDVTTSTRLLSAGVFYRAWESTLDGNTSAGTPRKFAVEPMAGLRETKLRSRISGTGISLSNDIDWTDLFVGARFKVDVSPSWTLGLQLDMAGIGSNSQRSENGMALLGYRSTVFGIPAVWQLAYRAMHQRYRSGPFEWNVTQSGFGGGLSLQF